MHKVTVVRQNLYSDSVSLMRMSNQVAGLAGVADVLVGMATELNKELLQNMGALTEEAEKAGPNDLVVGVAAETEDAAKAALAEVDALFRQKKPAARGTAEARVETIREAAALDEGYNLAVVSVPGIYAARECRMALESGMHVFLFSDNVTVDEEVMLKDLALRRGLLMMGPDCGTAIINGVPLGFANAVRPGGIGVVAASGTGLQHATTLIHHLGAGVSQAIGTGGRDLSAAVGGRTLLAALDALGQDENTRVVLILSKPPAPEVAEKVAAKAKSLAKPVVLCLLGRQTGADIGGLALGENIEQAACLAAELALGRPVAFDDKFYSEAPVEAFRKQRGPAQKYVRGIFGGGTVCDEAMVTFRGLGIPIRSNIPLDESERLADVHRSEGNTFIDMGDDYFTRGKPHPMIDPALRNRRIVADALLPDTAVMLLDVELGYGSHPDPAGVALAAVAEAREKLGGRRVLWVACLLGTEGDPQGYGAQAQKLLDAGFVVSESNVRAARLAARLVQEGGDAP